MKYFPATTHNKFEDPAAAFLILLLATCDFPSTSHAATPTAHPQFHVKDQWNLGGKGGWGFLVLDAPAHRLYIPRTNRVMVVDTETGKPIGEVEDMKNIRDIALDDSGKYGYVTDVTDGSAGFVRVFDRATLKLVTSIPTGAMPAAIVFDPSSKSIFVFNSRGHSATVIDSDQPGHRQPSHSPAVPARRGRWQRSQSSSRCPHSAKLRASTPPQKRSQHPGSLRPAPDPAASQSTPPTINSSRPVKIRTWSPSMRGQAMYNHRGRFHQEPAILIFAPKQNLVFSADINGTLSIFHREPSGRYRSKKCNK